MYTKVYNMTNNVCNMGKIRRILFLLYMFILLDQRAYACNVQIKQSFRVSHVAERDEGSLTARAVAYASPNSARKARMVQEENRGKVLSKRSFLTILLPWLYFMSTSMQIPSMPNYVNSIVNSGDAFVSPQSARVYGQLQGLDSFFTFLSVNAIGLLSDSWGRKPFMIYSSAGLGVAYSLIMCSKSVPLMYLAAAIDGCSSCMLSQAQAYIADCTNKNDLSIELGGFQGVAVGMAFFFGVPLGSYLSLHVSPRAPLLFAVFLCVINVLATALFLPESLNKDVVRKRSIPWSNANPFGTISMFGRNRKFAFAAFSYFLLQLAQSGMQVTWINYLQHTFGWTGVKSGMTLMIVGLVVAFLPGLIVPKLGVKKSIQYCLFLHSISLFGLGVSRSVPLMLMFLVTLSGAASALPIMLGFLSEQVDYQEIGALQGSADTLRTLAGIVANPLVSFVFASCIKNNISGGALYLSASFSFISALVFCFSQRS